jgi:hypothetical protein
MNARRWIGALLVVGALVVLGVGAYGQDKDKQKDKDKDKGSEATKLTLKAFEIPEGKTEGQPFYQEMTTKTKQVMKVMQMEVTQNQDQTFWVKWTPQKRSDKQLVVKQTITDVKMDIEIGGNKISYDSTAKDQPANPLTDFFKALKGAEFTIYINDDPQSDKFMTVTKVEGREMFVKNLAAANAQLQPLLNSILSDDALKSMAEPAFGVIPPKGVVPPDKKWKRESKLDMGPIGTYDTTYHYTYKGSEKEMAAIDVDTTLKYSAPKDAKKDGLPFKIVKADLASKEGKGVVHFDLVKGRVNDSKMDLKLEGKLTIEIGGMTTDVELTQTQTAELKTMDEDPNKKK